jgi:hypothetical protein
MTALSSNAIRLLALVLLSSLPPSTVAAECSSPLPSDFQAPQQSAADKDRLVGVWGGAMWDGVLCHTLVVESLQSDGTAAVIYSHGAYASWGIRAPGFYRMPGRVVDDVLHLEFTRAKARAEYRIVDGSLQGKYFSQFGVSSVVLKPMK